MPGVNVNAICVCCVYLLHVDHLIEMANGTGDRQSERDRERERVEWLSDTNGQLTSFFYLSVSSSLSRRVSLPLSLNFYGVFFFPVSRLVAIALLPFEKHCHHLIVIKMCLSCCYCCCCCVCIRNVCCSHSGFTSIVASTRLAREREREKCAWRGTGCVTPMPLPFRFMFCCVT